MILYFSGTGNSRYIAEVINSVIEDKLVSINECLKNNLIVSLEQQYIIVCPTYAWRIPRVVEQFIRTNHFVSGTKIYFIMTCGGDIGMLLNILTVYVMKKYDLMGSERLLCQKILLLCLRHQKIQK